ncbi:hypothetical protein [uncultured Shewanella sp.]|uniref:hypothetical protein n=1 Tax=uncultured Shewanella sp. TaxID=173975 RepID=UPI002617D0AF|nr:hypothetical protein [uncultured Shewanella sp.]
MDKLTMDGAQEVLLNITKIIETECSQDASTLLGEGFVLLAVNTNVFEDSENRFVYALGFPKPIDKLSEWAKSNF